MPSLVVSTLKVWDSMIKGVVGSTYRGPMTPLFSNPEFPMALEAKSFLKWRRCEDTRIVEMMEGNRILPLEAMGVEYKKEWMQYGLLQRYISSLIKESEMDRPLTTLEKVFIQEHRPLHVLSKIYKYLNSENKIQELPYIKKWEVELGIDIPRKKWEKAIMVTHKLSLSAKHQERNYKILARWYKCPVDLRKINPDNGEECWRCLKAQGTKSHIWYYCSKIQPFWQKIFESYSVMTGIDVYPDIQVAVLSMIPGSLKNIKKGLLKYFLTAARTIIARNWKSTNVPSMVDWEWEMVEMRALEERKVLEEGFS